MDDEPVSYRGCTTSQRFMAVMAILFIAIACYAVFLMNFDYPH